MNQPHTPETIREALYFIPADCDRETWVRMAMASKSELGDAGFPIWDEWSQSGATYNAAEARSVWRGIKEGGRVGIGSLFYEAMQHGFKFNGHHARHIGAAELEQIRRERELRLKQEEAERVRRQDAAAKLAEEIYSAGKKADDSHPYLKRKGVSAAPGVKVGQWYQIGEDGKRYREKENCLLIPIRDETGKLWNVQAIFPEPDASINRDRDYLDGGRKQGCYFSIGSSTERIVIAEGYATAKSIHEASGGNLSVAVAFDVGNLLPVAKALRAKFPSARLTVAADNDIRLDGKKNIGVAKAHEAAVASAADVAVPELDGIACDFNDLHLQKGPEAVMAAIQGARQPEAPKIDSRQQEQEEAKTKMKSTSAPEPKIVYQCMADITAKAIHWLWPGRIARGKPTMLAGNPSLGKSQITASWAAVVTTGGKWPVTREQCQKGSVLFLSAEDDPADTIRPRLEAAGADVTKVHVLQSVSLGFRSDGDEIHRAFNLKEDIRRLEVAIKEIGDVALVVIDPVSAYLGNGDSHNNAEVRALLAPLSEMASRQDAAILLVSHLNKGVGGDALARVTGSLAFVAASRAAFIVAKDPDNPERRLFIPAKNNIAKDSGAMAFTIEGHNLDGGIETSRIVWEGALINGITADDVLNQPNDPEEKDARGEAKAFLLELLAGGSREATEVFSNAKDAGISEKTLRRAAQELKVVKEKQSMAKGWKWYLPGPNAPKMAKGAEDAHSKTEGNFGDGGHLRDSETIA